jgi:hypothetical protein
MLSLACPARRHMLPPCHINHVIYQSPIRRFEVSVHSIRLSQSNAMAAQSSPNATLPSPSAAPLINRLDP